MPEAQPKATRKRPGGALDDLVRKTIHLKSAEDQNWLPGAAEARLTHGPAYALGPEDLKNFMSATGHGDSLGVTFSPGDPRQVPSMRISSAINMPDFLGGSPYVKPTLDYLRGNTNGMPLSIIPQPGLDPIDKNSENAVTARHEIAHQAADSIGEYGVNIPDRAVDFLKARGYKDLSAYASEYIANMASRPSDLGQTDDEGKQAMSDFIKQVSQRDPGLAKRWRQQLGIASPSTTEADRNLQPPNATF